MKIQKNWIHFVRKYSSISPYLSPVKNTKSLLFSLFLNKNSYNVKLKNGLLLQFKSEDFHLLVCLLGLLCFSINNKIISKKKLEFAFDEKNLFLIDFDNFNLENRNLLQVLFYGIRSGANFTTTNIESENSRDKAFKIYTIQNKKIIETSDGIKFFLDSIQPGNTIVETFVNKIHLIKSNENWNEKIVIDVGAECGDTPLYYANLGAKVYAFEPMNEHFEAMTRNLELNPEISKRIIPIKAAIGKNGVLDFYQSQKAEISGGASFVYDLHAKEGKITKVQGYGLSSALKQFNVQHVDLLKMDCKGCEFFLKSDELQNVDKVKIEYVALDKSHRLEKLLKILDNAGFECVIYRIDPYDNSSNKTFGHIFGMRKQN